MKGQIITEINVTGGDLEEVTVKYDRSEPYEVEITHVIWRGHDLTTGGDPLSEEEINDLIEQIKRRLG
jgi:hypothetical protein